MQRVVTGFNEKRERMEQEYSKIEKIFYTATVTVICIALMGTIVLLLAGAGIVLAVQDVRAH